MTITMRVEQSSTSHVFILPPSIGFQTWDGAQRTNTGSDSDAIFFSRGELGLVERKGCTPGA